MTIEELGSIGEAIAAIATIGTLFYLALQIRASNRLSRAEAWRSPNSDLNALNASFGTNAVFRSAISRCYFEGLGRDAFETDDRVVLDLYLISLTNIYEQIFREVREGILPEEALSDFGARNVIATTYYQESWSVLRGNFGHSFVEYFEESSGLVQESQGDA